MEWLESEGFHMACWAVSPSTAMPTGTNQSSLFQVVWNCRRRIERRVGSAGVFGCWANAGVERLVSARSRRLMVWRIVLAFWRSKLGEAIQFDLLFRYFA